MRSNVLMLVIEQVHISTSLTRLDGALDVKLWTDQKIGPFSYLNPNFNITFQIFLAKNIYGA